jgi:hypothetical protein
MLTREDDFQRKYLKFKLCYNGAKLVETLEGTIDYILEDKYSSELNDAMKKFKQKNKNVRVVNDAFFLDIIEKTNKSFY